VTDIEELATGTDPLDEKSNPANSMAEIIEDIAGNANNINVTEVQLNSIDGVTGAVADVNYTVALEASTLTTPSGYVDPANPTAEEIQAVVTKTNGLLDVLVASKDEGNATAEQLDIAGINETADLTTAELLSINELLDLTTPAPSTPKDLEELVTKAKELVVKVAEVVTTAGSENEITNEQLIAVGIVGGEYTADELKVLNEFISKSDPKPTTTSELQALVDEAKGEAKKIADLIIKGDAGDITEGDLSGITGIEAPITPEELLVINELLDNVTPKPTTIEELKRLVAEGKDKADKLKKLLLQGEGEGDIGEEDIKEITGTTELITLEELLVINELLDNVNPKPTTVDELKKLVDEGKDKADKLKKLLEQGEGEGDIGEEAIQEITGTTESITPEELLVINELLDNVNPKPTTPEELNILVEEGKDKATKIKNLLEQGEGNGNVTEEDILEITGTTEEITPDELVIINELIDRADPKPTTPEEIINLINESKEQDENIKNLLEQGEGTGNVTGEEIQEITGTGDSFTPEELLIINELIDSADPKPSTPEALSLLIEEGLEKAKEALLEIVEDISGNENEEPATAEQLNTITGVEGAREELDYSEGLANGTYEDRENPTAQEIQSVVDAVNHNHDGMLEVMEDIAGNANERPATATEINAIFGLNGAREGVDYSSELADAEYVDIENPTSEEIQSVIDAKNRYLDENSATADSESGVKIATIVEVEVLANDDLERLNEDSIQIEGTKEAGDSLIIKGEGVWSVMDGKIIFTPEENFVYDPTPISYSLETIDGERVATAIVEVNYEGHIRDDIAIVADLNKPVIIDVLKNDNGDLDPTSVEIVVPIAFMDDHEGARFMKGEQTGKRLLVPNEGTWVVENNGSIVYTPLEGVTTEPTPISYKVFEKSDNTYLEGGEVVIKKTVVAGVDDLSECQTSDSVPVFTKVGLGLLAMFGSIFGLFLFRKEKKKI